MRERLYKIEKNETEQIVIKVANYKGQEYIDVRLWFSLEGETELRPSKKGIILTPEMASQVAQALLTVESEREREKVQK